MQKLIGYVRVSTTDQADNGVSIEAQEAKIRAWAAVNDYEVSAVFVDAGKSGKRADNREALQQALDMACREKAAFCVYSLSRASRNTRDAIDISERLAKAGSCLVSLTEKVDNSASGRMIFSILASIHTWERDSLAEKTSMAMQHLKSQGYRVGACPVGYTVDETGKLIPLAEEMETVKLIQDLRAEGLSLRGIQGALEARGIANRGGSKWRLNTLAEIVKRKAA